MRPAPIPALLGLLLLAACAPSGEREVRRALREVDAIGQAGLTDVMMTVAEPEEAVAYFTRASAGSPDRLDLRRGLAEALIRAGRTTEAVPAWQEVAAHPESTDADRVELAGAYIRTNQWDLARATLARVPPTHESYERYRYEAMAADAARDWARADSFYEIAAGLTTTPASVLNNWGFSKLTRGDYGAAERLFTDALRHEPDLFTAKNNLVLARGAQRDYALPVVPMTQEERARLLYTLALAAIKQDDLSIGRSLLADAVETSPTHFEEAARALEAMG
ncbi:tetratricopeptide repeat protein [Rubellimicrobium aerolatum]|uniref:Tetratricopeptide repeat protein n=1 Tax=Rubellimicrobium aerolatum TaxID=490979 RepID=A0ABW0SFH2_9RHOB|nr:tetratricopeptide repeat protein [Rubellimicrobium aerolatum]MBP1807133.1 Flp pilus assembly protein TadD [Rubellimicrobium aerolatum]